MIVCMVQKRSGNFFNKIFQSCIKLTFRVWKQVLRPRKVQHADVWGWWRQSHLTVQDTELWKDVTDHPLATPKIMSMVHFHMFLGDRQQRHVVTSQMFLQCLQDGLFILLSFTPPSSLCFQWSSFSLHSVERRVRERLGLAGGEIRAYMAQQ